MLRVDVVEWFDRYPAYEEYSTFQVGPESNGYTLNVSSIYHGDAGNSVDNYILYILQ